MARVKRRKIEVVGMLEVPVLWMGGRDFPQIVPNQLLRHGHLVNIANHTPVHSLLTCSKRHKFAWRPQNRSEKFNPIISPTQPKTTKSSKNPHLTRTHRQLKKLANGIPKIQLKWKTFSPSWIPKEKKTPNSQKS